MPRLILEGREMELKENQQVIEEIVTLPDKSKEEKAAEFDLFRDNFDLVLKHSDLIISTPEYYHSHRIGLPIGLACMGGYVPPLGALLELWAAGEIKGTLYLSTHNPTPSHLNLGLGRPSNPCHRRRHHRGHQRGQGSGTD